MTLAKSVEGHQPPGHERRIGRAHPDAPSHVQAVLALQRAAGNAAVTSLVETALQREPAALAPALPPDMTAPYHPGEESKRYWALPAEQRSGVNARTDAEFEARTGITARLDEHNAKDRPAVRMWLRLRDEQIEAMPAESAPTATVPAPAAESGTSAAAASGSASSPGSAPAKVDTDEVGKLIAKHQTLKFLDEAGLAADLAPHLPGDPAFVSAAIKNLYWWHQRDDTSAELAKKLSDDDLVKTASDATGKALLLYMVSEMQGIHTSDDDKKQGQRVMHAISKADLAQSGHVEIEVLTFRRGFAPLDWAGEHLFGKGAKGHTAVVAGGIAYSFDERGWIVAGTEKEYLDANTHRDAIGQVLDVPEADAEKVQAALDDSVGTGTYLLNKGEHVCTDEAARALQAALGTLDAKHNPQEFAKTLEAKGIVKKTNPYPATK